MGRLGFAWKDAADRIRRLAVDPALSLEGLCTHFASSDSPDRKFTDTQAKRFTTVAAACRKSGLPRLFLHASNSGGILRDGAWDMDGVRPGILLYGYARGGGTDSGTDCRVRTRPFLQWKTRVLQVKRVPAGFPVSYDSTFVTDRETCIATVDVGYADGYSRLLSNRGAVVIGGRRRPIAGRVTMNLVTVDAGPEGDVQAGDEVVLLGEQNGTSIWADELAGWCETIPYEILTSIRTDRRVTSQ
jgi:alanine racemase